MAPPHAKRRLVIYVALIVGGLAVCGWQAEEHVRFRREAEQALINRGSDITSTLGLVIHSQRRFGGMVSKERLQRALEELIRPGELESIVILGATGETIASAGDKIEVTPDMLRAHGVFWRDRTLSFMNLMDLGPNAAIADENARPHPPILVTDEKTARALRTPPPRPAEPAGTVEGTAKSGGTDGAAAAGSTTMSPAPRPANEARFPYARPSWMSKEYYDSVIQKQGVHSLVISLSTVQMRRSIEADLLLRSLVSLLAMGGVIVSALAWRNLARNAQLQIRLVKAGEMNTHLKEMNLAAAGLAHETRNPLNLIRGMAQMIAMQAKEAPKLQEHAAAIIEEADRVTVQLNEFINYSKPREAQFAPVDMARLVADVARTLLPDIEEKRIELRQPESALRIEADEQLLRQALFNVLLNAIQAVGQGGRIEVRLTAVGPREATLEIADDGPGVGPEHRATIFKPYVTMRPKGVGLGLAIVAQITAAHHWEVACLPNEPRGAVFRFSRLKIAAA